MKTLVKNDLDSINAGFSGAEPNPVLECNGETDYN